MFMKLSFPVKGHSMSFCLFMFPFVFSTVLSNLFLIQVFGLCEDRETAAQIDLQLGVGG